MLGSQMQQVAGDVRALEVRLNNVLAGLTWEVKSKVNVDGQWQSARGTARNAAQVAETLGRYVVGKAQAFEDADRQGAGGMQQVTGFLATAVREWLQSPLARVISFPRQTVRDLWNLVFSAPPIPGWGLATPFMPFVLPFVAVGALQAVAPLLWPASPAPAPQPSGGAAPAGGVTQPSQPSPSQSTSATAPPAGTSAGVGQTTRNEWIPSNVMTYNGSSDAEKYFMKYEKKFTKLKWNQDKLNDLWRATIEIEKQYHIQIDPRFLLAIIIQEGTGSFNTSSANRAADGQHGVETNFAVDLMKANSLVFGKILGYIYYGSEFRQAVSNNNDKPGITGNGDIFQYCNWNTPIIRMNSNKVEAGVYAGHGSWGEEVRKHYIALGGNANSYEEYISNIDKSVVENIVKEEGFQLPAYRFIEAKEAQDSKGVPNGGYIIKGVR
jgi:hypothetical protein